MFTQTGHTPGDHPLISDDPLYQLVRARKIAEFNNQRGESCDFSGLDFRGIDLRGIDAHNIDFSHCYFHGADLRGVDFSTSRMEGTSIHKAHIAGSYFPSLLSATEITLSHLEGTRMRYTLQS